MILLLPFATYLAFNLACGPLCAALYLLREHGLTNRREFLLMAVLPFIGLGVWAHGRKGRIAGMAKPLAYYVLSRMSLLNLLFVALVAAWLIWGVTDAVQYAMTEVASSESDPDTAPMADMIAGLMMMIGTGFAGGFALTGVALFSAVLMLVMVAAPLFIAVIIKLAVAKPQPLRQPTS